MYPATDAMFTIEPEPCSIIVGSTARIVRNAAFRQTSWTKSQVSSSISQIGANLLMPTLLCSTSTRPHRSVAACTIAAMCSGSRTSTVIPMVSTPWASWMSAATCAGREVWASVTTSLAPSAA